MVITTLVFVWIPIAVWGQSEWTWKDAAGKRRTRADLDKILNEHDWSGPNGSHGGRVDLHRGKLSHADLAGADLTEANLSGADLTYADLQGTYLAAANLSEANLSDANMYRAKLNGADLSSSHLESTDLRDAKLVGADLRAARLYGTDLRGTLLRDAKLTGADLTSANLGAADLVGADLKDAFFGGADLQYALFEPRSLPEIRGIAGAHNLEFLTYEENPDALVQLRKAFQENGFREQEREITYALNRERAALDGPVEQWFNRVAFDLPCQYGMNPGRALRIWLVLLLLCWLAYAVLIHLPGESGIYRIEKRVDHSDGDQTEEQIRPGPISAGPWWKYPPRAVYRELRVLFWAGFFSLMSAFNIAFRDINFGRWLRLLPRTEYDLKAKGWARTVAGFQSLVSVYLIALWVLTYFGSPFQ